MGVQEEARDVGFFEESMRRTGIFYTYKDVVVEVPQEYLNLITREIRLILAEMILNAVSDGRIYQIVYSTDRKDLLKEGPFRESYRITCSASVKLNDWHRAEIDEYVAYPPSPSESTRKWLQPAIKGEDDYQTVMTNGGWVFTQDDIGWQRVN